MPYISGIYSLPFTFGTGTAANDLFALQTGVDFNDIGNVLAGGAGSVTLFLRGDGAWAVPPGAAGPVSFWQGFITPNTTSYSVNGATDSYKLISSSNAGGTLTVTLPVPSSTFTIGFARTTNNIIINHNAAESIFGPWATAGVSSYTMTNQYDILWLISDGGNWFSFIGTPSSFGGSGSTTKFLRGDGQWATTVTTFPLLAPDGTVTAPSYSWANETNSGWYRPSLRSFTLSVNGVNTFNVGVATAGLAGVFSVNDGTVGVPAYTWNNETTSGIYRAGLKDMRATVNSADVNRWTDHNFDMGYKVVAGDGTTFYYPTGISNANSFGLIARFNRIFVGTEALEGAQLNQSPLSWVASAYNNVNPNAFGSVNITNQLGGYPIVASTRTSDFRTAYASASGGSGAYFLALNDDTGSGGPIASALNATAVRNSSSITGSSQALQVDVENRGNTVDDTPWAFGSGDTRGITITNGAFFNPVNPASAGIYIGSGNGASPGNFRKGILVANNALDLNVGTFGGGTWSELALGMGTRWIKSDGTVVNELGCTINGCGPIFSLRAGDIGIWPGIGFGGTVTQTTSITTAVTINKTTGQITTVSNAWVSGFSNGQAFIVNNNTLTANDCVVVNVKGGSGNYICWAGQIQAGSFQLSLVPLLTVTEAVTINFILLKARPD